MEGLALNYRKPRTWITFVAFVVIVCVVGGIIGISSAPGAWYQSLTKASWNPPNWIFGPVWSALYTMMAVAAWLVWKRGGFAVQRVALTLFLLQLCFNALWSPLFFGLRHPGLGLVDIVLLWLTLAGTVIVFWKACLMAGALMVPYLAWVTFASALNFAIWRLNP